jgi:apolipoprotein D and lipocalin family protein
MNSRRVLLTTLLSASLVACATGRPEGVVPVQDFHADQYLGTWFEIARLDHSFERGLSNVTAEYRFNEDGTIRVVNRGYQDADSRWRSATGKARFKGDDTVGSLEVSFFGPFYGSYIVIDLDPAYKHALVAGPSTKYLWILAREPALSEEVYARLISKANGLGFDTDALIRVRHDANLPPQ